MALLGSAADFKADSSFDRALTDNKVIKKPTAFISRLITTNKKLFHLKIGNSAIF